MKPWYESKTILFNVIMTIVMSVPVIAAAYKAMTPEQAVFVDSIAGLITGLGNVFIRVWFTDGPIDSPRMRERWLDIYDEN